MIKPVAFFCNMAFINNPQPLTKRVKLSRSIRQRHRSFLFRFIAHFCFPFLVFDSMESNPLRLPSVEDQTFEDIFARNGLARFRDSLSLGNLSACSLRLLAMFFDVLAFWLIRRGCPRKVCLEPFAFCAFFCDAGIIVLVMVEMWGVEPQSCHLRQSISSCIPIIIKKACICFCVCSQIRAFWWFWRSRRLRIDLPRFR